MFFIPCYRIFDAQIAAFVLLLLLCWTEKKKKVRNEDGKATHPFVHICELVQGTLWMFEFLIH